MHYGVNDRNIRSICSCFPWLKELFLDTTLTSSQIAYLIGTLQYLSYLEFFCALGYNPVEEAHIVHRLLFKQNNRLRDERISYRFSEGTMCLWLK